MKSSSRKSSTQSITSLSQWAIYNKTECSEMEVIIPIMIDHHPTIFLRCALAATQCICNRSCLWVCDCVCVFVRLLPRLLEIACIDPHQTGSVGKGSDHLQLIKFWLSHTPGKGVCGGAKFLGPLYYSQHAVFASPPSTFFHSLLFWLDDAQLI